MMFALIPYQDYHFVHQYQALLDGRLGSKFCGRKLHHLFTNISFSIDNICFIYVNFSSINFLTTTRYLQIDTLSSRSQHSMSKFDAYQRSCIIWLRIEEFYVNVIDNFNVTWWINNFHFDINSMHVDCIVSMSSPRWLPTRITKCIQLHVVLYQCTIIGYKVHTMLPYTSTTIKKHCNQY